MTDVQTHTLSAGGATITYDLHGAGLSEDVLFLIGSPMDASGFATLASHFTDRTVATYDPRCVSRSPRTDGAEQTTPEEHADDLRRVIEALGARNVDVFASSGGAVNALALVAAHGDLVRTLVAHEPPAVPVLPDREQALAACADVRETYLREGQGPAMVKFILLATRKGPVPAGWAEEPVPSPEQFGMPAGDDGSRDDPLLGQNMIPCTGYRPDFDALRAASTRIVVGVGEESAGELAHRAGLGVAAGLGADAVLFPGDHSGFLGGEFGQQGRPVEFAKALRDVLDAD
ncbi:alpha/beta fold hydrolase [Streptomyces sp. NPDC060194]|uniref:alpha/beta fold hydrolase n=1 Tax=Streptomyces sp. NPDC060194 TaxID=3347069 RepID=UPI00365E0DB2